MFRLWLVFWTFVLRCECRQGELKGAIRCTQSTPLLLWELAGAIRQVCVMYVKKNPALCLNCARNRAQHEGHFVEHLQAFLRMLMNPSID